MTANERITWIMSKLDIKQIDILEKEPELKQNTLSSNLSKSEWPTPQLAVALAKHWDVNLNWVYTGEGAATNKGFRKAAVQDYLKEQLEVYLAVSDWSD